VWNELHFYNRSNYDWTLKYSMQVEKINFCKFSDAVSLRLFIVYESGKFQSIEFKKEYNNSLYNNNFITENGSVAVISGNKIKLTPLGYVNIPPPMSLSSIDIKGTSPFVINWWKNYLFVLSNHNLAIILTQERSYKIIAVYEDIKEIKTTFLKSFIFTLSSDSKYGYLIMNKSIIESDDKDLLTILTFSIESDNIETMKYLSAKDIEIKRTAGIMFNSVLSDKLYDDIFFKKSILENKQEETNKKEVDLFSGLKKVDDDRNNYFYYVSVQENKEKLFNKAKLIFSEDNEEIDIETDETNIYSKFDVIKAKSVVVDDEQERIVYLTKNNRLYMDNTLLALDTSSFEFFKKFLIFTQTSNTPYNILHIIDLTNFDNIMKNHTDSNEAIFSPNFNYKTFSMRTLERGSLVVTISKINLVLQMPRGNLETIYPRLLVLDEIAKLISEKNYSQAYELARKHKINTNFLYDIDPEGFYTNISEFVGQVKKVNIIINIINIKYIFILE
jgi:elongator complex protein 1